MPHYVEGKEVEAPLETWSDLEKHIKDTTTRHADLGRIAAKAARYERDTEQFFLPTMEDVVNHPTHYNKHGVECIEAIRATLTDEEFRGYCKGNVLKYTWRERYKNGFEDLRKAMWYLERLVNDIRKNQS